MNPSRFLEDIPKDLLVVTEYDEKGSPTEGERLKEHEAKVSDFLSQIKAKLSQ